MVVESHSGKWTYSVKGRVSIKPPDVQYYEITAPLSERPYLLPVFVFSGTAHGLQEEEFVLIVPAPAD